MLCHAQTPLQGALVFVLIGPGRRVACIIYTHSAMHMAEFQLPLPLSPSEHVNLLVATEVCEPNLA